MRRWAVDCRPVDCVDLIQKEKIPLGGDVQLLLTA